MLALPKFNAISSPGGWAAETGPRLAEKGADLPQQVRLISFSLDPVQDTPAALLDYAGHFRRKGFHWQFLTTTSESELLPILDGHGQSRQRESDEDGNYTGSISHILRVFLIDRQGRIRNIYSSGFLDAVTVINDLRILATESRAAPGS
ncbi:MAG: SCO family protein [Halioglobus sp.]|nr:SCO family protein [Halioglobus sp.]